MNPEDIAHILDDLGKRIGPYGEATWHILVSQKRLEGFVSVGAGILVVLVAVVFSFWFNRFANNQYDKIEKANEGKSSLYYSNDWATAKWIVPLFALALGLTLAIPPITLSVLQIFNPEYYAIQDLLRALP